MNSEGLKRGHDLPHGNSQTSELENHCLETSILKNDPIKTKNLRFKVKIGKVSCSSLNCSLHKGNASLDRVKLNPKGGGLAIKHS